MGSLWPLPRILVGLLVALAVAAPVAILLARRGGRFRALPGWLGFWVFFSALLVALSRAHPWVAFPLLLLLMWAGLRQYFFLTPVRPQDRWSLFATYLMAPLALWPAFNGREEIFTEAVPMALLIILPIFLCWPERQQSGLLDSMGRVLVGASVYVYCASFLGMMTHGPEGTLEMFGLLALVAELTQRVAGRFRPGQEIGRRAIGLAFSLAATASVGGQAAPAIGVTPTHGAFLGLVVAFAVGIGARVAGAVSRDLDVSAPQTMTGRAAFLDRTFPSLFAAPLFHIAARWFFA